MRRSDKKIWSVRSKVWLEIEGKPFMGPGRVEILESIDQKRSILRASQETGISYRRIWGAIRDMERSVGCSLIETQRGGVDGGGAVLTERARELMDRFRDLEVGIQKAIDHRFGVLFTDFFWATVMRPVHNDPRGLDQQNARGGGSSDEIV